MRLRVPEKRAQRDVNEYRLHPPQQAQILVTVRVIEMT